MKMTDLAGAVDPADIVGRIASSDRTTVLASRTDDGGMVRVVIAGKVALSSLWLKGDFNNLL